RSCSSSVSRSSTTRTTAVGTPARRPTAPASTATPARCGRCGRVWSNGCGAPSTASRWPTCSATKDTSLPCCGRAWRTSWPRRRLSSAYPSAARRSQEATMTTPTSTILELADRAYRHGFETPVEADTVPRGLSEDVIRQISARKQEPAFLLEWRLKAYRHWLTMQEPRWANVRYGPIDYQDIIYYAAPKPKNTPGSLDE